MVLVPVHLGEGRDSQVPEFLVDRVGFSLFRHAEKNLRLAYVGPRHGVGFVEIADGDGIGRRVQNGDDIGVHDGPPAARGRDQETRMSQKLQPNLARLPNALPSAPRRDGDEAPVALDDSRLTDAFGRPYESGRQGKRQEGEQTQRDDFFRRKAIPHACRKPALPTGGVQYDVPYGNVATTSPRHIYDIIATTGRRECGILAHFSISWIVPNQLWKKVCRFILTSATARLKRSCARGKSISPWPGSTP